MTDTIILPSKVFSGAQANAGINVGKGNLCRIFGVSDSLVTFSDLDSLAVPTSTDDNAAQLGQAVAYIIATEAFLRTTADVTRVEVIED